MHWITRERPKIDRLACPWLIVRFIDPSAVIHFVPEGEVITQAKALGAIPFDVPGVEYSHYEDRCTFDYFLHKHALTDPALHRMAPIIRGADTDDHSLTTQSAGLWAISAGLAHNLTDDQALMAQGLVLYDALFSWAKHLQSVRHTRSPTEQLLLAVLHNYLGAKGRQKVPAWVGELKEAIQDQIDTNLSLSLSTLAESLDINPAYVSRTFARYFDDLSFGEYIRKLRLDKALHLLDTTSYTLTEIAYLTGFSDQSHFTRIFKKQMGQNPSEYRKQSRKSKTGTKG
ncbi:helix-turn-helix domain-containing protein [Rudanella paleaurantiibacter]|uniref:Helix-turn-helix domain-containing protein n=1 Tax=Rudanella paleaurantiibacter TaxID=2614655 RepID=A0A7J5TTV8_9BACT|nr:chromate resistance protein ChrB domain-containing protein [Rudanella paleaurantiibacter]KAB7727316.1 helix-turn-helix domain-containing protein [Rudanella paleaurantiibacter]